MRFYFNNCCSRHHAALYGRGAFYDLYLTGKQADMATNIKLGDECVVATTVDCCEIEFDWFKFSHERILPMPDEPGNKSRVLFGNRFRSEILPKDKAAKTKTYGVFFNINGHFKRSSVIVQEYVK